MKKLLLVLAVATMTVGNAGCQCGPIRSWWKCLNEEQQCAAPSACGTCCPAPMGCGDGGGMISSPPMLQPGPMIVQ